MDDRADMKADGNPAARLTGRERFLRGVKYCLGTFAAVFAVCLVLVMGGTEWDPTAWVWGVLAGLDEGVPAGLVAGLVVMAFPRRRRWQGVLAVAVALVASFGWLAAWGVWSLAR